jgi:hypothetical protein
MRVLEKGPGRPNSRTATFQILSTCSLATAICSGDICRSGKNVFAMGEGGHLVKMGICWRLVPA